MPRPSALPSRLGTALAWARSRLLSALVFVGRLLLVLGAALPCALSRLAARLSPPPAPRPRRAGRPRILFVCGTINHTTQLHQIAAELPEFEHAFTWYYCDGALELFRKLGWLESTALGDKLRARCLGYLQSRGLPLDLGGARGDYDLVITCSDMVVPRNVRGCPLVLVQEGMTDPEDLIFRLVRALRLPPWLAITSSATSLSHAYDRFCVASEGYRAHFEQKGARPETIVVTGIPNFDDCERYRQNAFPHRDFVLVCSSDIRETARWEDRPRFIREVVALAAGRPIVWKLHPNENMPRARAELGALAPDACVYDTGCAEEMIANCSVLVTQYSSTAYVGLALGKEVHSYFDVAELRRLCPLQNGGASAARVAEVCRQLLRAAQRDRAAAAAVAVEPALSPAFLEDDPGLP